MRKISFILFCLLIFASCEKNNKAQTVPVESTYMDNCGECFSAIKMPSSGFLVNDEIAYKKLQDSTRNDFLGCDTASMPHIDFNKYTLLGLKTENQCTPGVIDKNVVNDISNKQYIYTVTIEKLTNPTCKMLSVSMNWVLVSKLPNGYTVSFKTIVK